MAGYLKEPVVLQWDMKTGSYGKIVQHIIEKKVCEWQVVVLLRKL